MGLACESMKQVSQSISQTVTQSVSQLLPVKVRKSISQLGRQLDSHAVNWPVSEKISQTVNH